MKRFAVVGAGLAGRSTAYALARRGHAVTVFEQFADGHDRGSSHGRSRIVRRAYPERRFTEIMVEAYPMWADLESASNTKLVHEVGLLYFGSADSSNLHEVSDGLQACDVRHQILPSKAVKEVFPSLCLATNEIGIWTPEAGWVEADTTLRIFRDLAESCGAVFRFETTPSPEELRTQFDDFAICAGSWMSEWISLDTQVTRQTFAYFDAKVSGPVWIEDSPELAYGFPSDDLGFKLALHSYGPTIDPADLSTTPCPTTLKTLSRVAESRFGLKNPELLFAKTCRYTNTTDEGFRFGRLPEGGVYATACSGHGFKFGPWIGEQVAKLILD